jgi:hypothetical protein
MRNQAPGQQLKDADAVERLWSQLRAPWIDRAALRSAVEEVREVPDHRTATLLAEARSALRDHDNGISTAPLGARFPYLWSWLMEPTELNTVKQLLREVGQEIPETHSLEIGGSIVLIWKGLLSRHTQDLDSVNEVPEAVRVAARSRQVEHRYGLRLTSFQSRCLPDGWHERLLDQGIFGNLHVMLVDPLDVMTSKLFSKRTPDLDDVRVIGSKWSAEQLRDWRDHVLAHARSLRSNAELERVAQGNWEILFGDRLYSEPGEVG